jgi:hypothetical protein
MANRIEGLIEWLVNDEFLWRQVHPNFLKGSQPTSAAFNPTEAHDYTLSTAREWLGPVEAYRQHIDQQLISAGTWAVRVAECLHEQVYPFDDSRLPGRARAHVSIPFRTRDFPRGKGERKQKAQALRDYAIAHGCRYLPAAGWPGVTGLP